MGASWGVSLIVVVIVVFAQKTKAEMSPSQCEQEKSGLVSECKAVILGVSPSARCCQKVRTMHLECVCPAVTPRLAALLGGQRIIKQVQGCGRPVPHHFKCGSKQIIYIYIYPLIKINLII